MQNKVAVPYFNIIFSIAVLGLVTRPRPRRAISVSGIRLERFVAPASRSVDFASETPHASVRAAGGSLGIAELTRCHAVVGQSPDPRADRISRRRGCVTILGESDRRGKTRSVLATVGDRYTTTASAEAVCSWIRRLSHHLMTPCEVCDAQSPARRPHRRVWSLRCELELDVRRGGR